jgi:hypothetical protein
MILPEFILTSRQHQIWTESGIDSISKCKDPVHFKNYPYKLEYHYNSRGFRDAEWPESLKELQDSIWCVGDSFTVGLGSPLTHTWPNILQSKTNKRCINVSMDGASNKWIARKVIEIINKIQPKIIVIQWSYIQRDELCDTTLTDEDRRAEMSEIACYNQLITNLYNTILSIELHKNKCNIIHSFIPSSNCGVDTHCADVWNELKGVDWPEMPKNYYEFNCLNKDIVKELTNFFNVYELFKSYYSIIDKIIYIPEIITLDLARDGYHYDKITATNFVAQLESLIVDLPQS